MTSLEKRVALTQSPLKIPPIPVRARPELHSGAVQQTSPIGRPSLDDIQIVWKEGCDTEVTEEIGVPGRTTAIHHHPALGANRHFDPRDPVRSRHLPSQNRLVGPVAYQTCLLYPSDAADDLLCVDLGG